MDANGQRFELYARDADFRARQGCAWQAQSRVLTLSREREPPPEAVLAARSLHAEQRLAVCPGVLDAWGQRASWSEDERMLRGADGALWPETAHPLPARDLALDAEQGLLLAFADQLRWVDLRGRFEPLRFVPPEVGEGERFEPFRLACDAQGGRWVLDRRHALLARLAGQAWRRAALRDAGPERFRPQTENPHPPHLILSRLRLGAHPSLGRLDPVALACSAAGQLALLAWGPGGRAFVAHWRAPQRGLSAWREMPAARHAHALRWLDEQHLALWAGQDDEAWAVSLDDGEGMGEGDWPLLGRRYPLRGSTPGAPPLQGQHWPPQLAVQDGARALVPLAWRAQRTQGQALLPRRDAGVPDAIWHRLVIEAELPPGCALLVELAARDDEAAPEEADFHPHWFGDSRLRPATLPAQTPQGQWQAASEVAWHPGLLPGERARSGCFGVLVQRADHQQRALRGRFLHGRLTLLGSGQRAPCLAALRVWGARFSYVQRYLPALFSDAEGADPTARGAASAVDFFERFTQLFESELTRWEDLVAGAHALTHPNAAPAPALPWLAGLLGEPLPAALPETRARAWLASAPQRARERGTLRGLQRALDVALDGAVTRGSVIVVEDFRLRRTLATLLGVELTQRDDPLLPGLHPSANSRVGDALILGDAAAARDFLTAFLPEALAAEAGPASAELAHDAFYERSAHRCTLLWHEDLSEAERRLAEAVTVLEAPAHVALRWLPARAEFLVGVAALVGIDTHLRAPTLPAWARIDVSRLGRGDRLLGGTLAERLEIALPQAAAPLAQLDGPASVDVGRGFVLSGERSRAADGRALLRFRWTHHGPAPPPV